MKHALKYIFVSKYETKITFKVFLLNKKKITNSERLLACVNLNSAYTK